MNVFLGAKMLDGAEALNLGLSTSTSVALTLPMLTTYGSLNRPSSLSTDGGSVERSDFFYFKISPVSS